MLTRSKARRIIQAQNQAQPPMRLEALRAQPKAEPDTDRACRTLLADEQAGKIRDDSPILIDVLAIP